MKKLVAAVALAVLSIGVNAQDNKMEDSKMQTNPDKKKDCIIMKDGKMMTMMSGTTTIMDKDMALKNGTMVMMDGTVKMKDGTTMKMKDGDAVDMEGKMRMHDKMNK